MTTQTSAGTLVKVSVAAPATHDAAGFAALTFTNVGEIDNVGEFGKKFETVQHKSLANRAMQKRKGSYDAGSLPLSVALDNDDAGQILMQAAADSDASYSYLVQLQNGDKYYFRAQCMSWMVGVGSADSMVKATAQLEIDSAVVLVNAA